jgi:bZIP-type transcription factor MBZ1
MNFNSQMSSINTDLDEYESSFFDFTPATTSPDIKSSMLTPQSALPSSSLYPAPSFQYDRYHQQTGIPQGALASTININNASGLHYNGGQFVMPTETLNMPLSDLSDFDFNQNPNDMEFENDADGLPSMFDSTNLVSPSEVPAIPQRIYPGMHQQQAQAKAQQAASKQQSRPQDQKQAPGPSPTKTAKDPLVEESISKVLNRMRQASAATISEAGDSPIDGVPGMPRIKKDEDDMDDDERLLASEEGKKLSSKERRQLRNKVSARAFRSRRKGKINLHPILTLY